MSGPAYELAPSVEHVTDGEEEDQVWDAIISEGVANGRSPTKPFDNDEAFQDYDLRDAEEGSMLFHVTERNPKREQKKAKALLHEEFSVGKNVGTDWGDLNPNACIEDEMGFCNYLSSVVCGLICRSKRLGNMPVLWSSKTSDGRTELKCIAGPFWPCLVFVTYPLILGCSMVVAVFHLQTTPLYLQVFWWGGTLVLLISLGCTGCRNPGIVRRWRAKPDGCSHWIWNDQGRTYRPPKARYDGDCGVVIEEFDHTCPWTGTGIGRRNMQAFQTFVCSLCICLILDVLLIGGALDGLA